MLKLFKRICDVFLVNKSLKEHVGINGITRPAHCLEGWQGSPWGKIVLLPNWENKFAAFCARLASCCEHAIVLPATNLNIAVAIWNDIYEWVCRISLHQYKKMLERYPWCMVYSYNIRYLERCYISRHQVDRWGVELRTVAATVKRLKLIGLPVDAYYATDASTGSVAFLPNRFFFRNDLILWWDDPKVAPV